MILSLFWLAAVVAIVTQLLIILTVIRQRQRWDRPGAVGPNPMTAELVWTMLPPVALLFLLAVTYLALTSLQ